ncbi:helix-turn-helix transcriptional regulator [Cytophagaceae bacterium YF14B1]|uniref:Helix-turn-helix transcriptional regulator n=1 Tax=Xanthocytophaga flava TaxID=3048013 RepID=A0AAE3QXN6_9BACT|nr:helix-turn-helix transcriptional regulator [Xanthocytophaga flavus]MDJ1485338.1 helix-turn-helix transcriptional regulator [Xanthocytophaga flavus]
MTQTLEDFYEEKFNWVPDTLRKDIGHFNVFRIEDVISKKVSLLPFSRRDYFKVSLIIGRRKIHYADQSIEIKKQALLFSSPQIPYSMEILDDQQTGYISVFTSAFFHHFGNPQGYKVFQPDGNHIFELSDEECAKACAIYEKMQDELVAEYLEKYDALRVLVFGLLLSTMKMHSPPKIKKTGPNAAQRIALLFLELLERQFPIDNPNQRVALHTPADFAGQMSVHVNHLNKALRETTEKTTSDIIAERILQEAKILLKGTHWNVSEIAYTLGFNEATHFNNFFKKHLQISPTQFRID